MLTLSGLGLALDWGRSAGVSLVDAGLGGITSAWIGLARVDLAGIGLTEVGFIALAWIGLARVDLVAMGLTDVDFIALALGCLIGRSTKGPTGTGNIVALWRPGLDGTVFDSLTLLIFGTWSTKGPTGIGNIVDAVVVLVLFLVATRPKYLVVVRN